MRFAAASLDSPPRMFSVTCPGYRDPVDVPSTVCLLCEPHVPIDPGVPKSYVGQLECRPEESHY
jgi:hypothetical protein